MTDPLTNSSGAPLRVAMGADHGGYLMKDDLAEHLRSRGVDVLDLGTNSGDRVDYPEFGAAVGRAVAAGDADLGVCICGSGIGISIAANKVAGIRAVTAHDSFSVERGVLSNNAQVLTMGQRVIGIELARRLVREWLTYRFDETSASAEKVAVIGEYEATGSC